MCNPFNKNNNTDPLTDKQASPVEQSKAKTPNPSIPTTPTAGPPPKLTPPKLRIPLKQCPPPPPIARINLYNDAKCR